MDNAAFNDGLIDFLNASPTPFHATAAMVNQLEGAGDMTPQQRENMLSQALEFYTMQATGDFPPPPTDQPVLTPEEHVRQYVLQYFIHQLNYPSTLIAVEKQIKLTISAVVEASGTAPEKKERYAKLKAEFELELTMIRMNLEHLLKRYRNELEAAMNDPRKDMLLTLDAYEATAVENAKQLYARVQRLQQGH